VVALWPRNSSSFRKKAVEALDALQESFAPVKIFKVKKLKEFDDTFRIRTGD
jgi:mRNA-degrading endonuclease RelE of RelBE toxin-antitoxin system